MEPPVEPCDEDCCGSGCDPCIFDVYLRQQQLYEKYKNGQLTADETYNRPNIISETKYTSFKIVFIVHICDDHSYIAFKHERTDDSPKKIFWKPGQHFLMKFVKDSITSTRAYTPLILKKIHEVETYDFLIIMKKYKDGAASTFLDACTVENNILWRGPYGSFEYVPNKNKKVCMIAQGTGIAPFHTLIKSVLDNEEDFSILILLCCYRDMDSILLRNELYLFNKFWNFTYKIFIGDKCSNNESILYKEPLVFNRMTLCDIKSAMWPVIGGELFLICGSPKFEEDLQNYLLGVGVGKELVFKF